MQPRPDSTLALYQRLFAIARPYRLHIAGVMLLSLLSTPLALLAPLPLKIVVDSVVGGHSLPDWTSRVLPFDSAPGRALAAAVIVLLGVALLGELQGMATWVLQTYTTEQLLLRFRAQLFAHVQRLSMRLGFTRATDPKDIEKDLMKVIPQESWIRFSHQVIWHGRRVCFARKPNCAGCTLAPFCPSAGLEG